MGGRQRDAVAGELQRRLDQARPGQPAEALVQSSQTGRKPGHAAGSRADRVVDELLAEGHLQFDRRRPRSGRNVDEAVESHCLGSIPVDRVAAAEEPGHDGLGDAGRETRGDGGVGCRPALLENLDSRSDRGGMTGCDRGWQHGLLPY